MRNLVLWGLAAALAGCGGGITQQELDTVKRELLANDEHMAAKLRSDLAGVDQKVLDFKQLYQDLKNLQTDLNALQKKLLELSKQQDAKIDRANANVIKSMEFEERLLSERLAQVRLLLEEVKKK